MLNRIIQLFFALVGGALGYQWGDPFLKAINFGEIPGSSYIGALIGALLFFIGTSWLADYLVRLVRKSEDFLVKFPVTDLMFGALGLIIGLIVAFLLIPSISVMSAFAWDIVGSLLPVAITAFLGYLGFRVGYKKRDEIASVLSLSRKERKKENKNYVEHKILDTSVIIDGRIADICKAGFIEGVLVIPEFVLEELQHIADSSDVLKRNRGRRGLDILNKIQKELKVKVQIYEGDFEEISEVDSKLVKLAKILQGKVITNDFNLNKVCELQGVAVMNINDLANAVKPVVLPGEEITVQVIKDGKEYGQGVAYLDDGTMIVVEGGREFIGNTMEVLVTSVLQTSAGRMIFAKPKLLERAL